MTAAELVGTVFAERYEILSVIGEGGRGKAYKARPQIMRRLVAIKILHPHFLKPASYRLRLPALLLLNRL